MVAQPLANTSFWGVIEAKLPELAAIANELLEEGSNE